jgi:hypothetical protein
MKYTITLAAAAVALMASVVSAQAGCAYPGTLKAGSLHTIPAFIIPNMKPPVSSAQPNSGNAAQNIVGTWLVTYTANGSPSGQAFIQWHDDGTEWENINFPILRGNVCLGSWKSVDPLHVTRLHYGWLYTDGTLSGYFTETETDKASHRNAYSGVNDTKIFDLNGNVLAEFPGTSSAVRIAP